MSDRSPSQVTLSLFRESGCAERSPRVQAVQWNFGVPAAAGPHCLVNGLTLPLAPGRILLISGPSGSGKTSLLHEMKRQLPRAVVAGGSSPRGRRAVIDDVAPRESLALAMSILTACGMGEPALWLRRSAELSEGERFRFRLAQAIGRALRADPPAPILCDEFGATLHRRLAAAAAFSLRKLVTRHRLMLVAAATHAEFAADLRPDLHVTLGGERPHVRRAPGGAEAASNVSWFDRLTVEPGNLADYRAFAPMHYRQRDLLGFVDRVFVLRDGDEPLGVVLYAHPPIELSLRNSATGGRFVRNGRRLNREMRILRRLVLHPDVRGVGLGHWLVRRTLPLAGVRFVECLAALGAVNPVFERAGMIRVGICPLPRGRLRLLQRMRSLRLDPFSHEFPRRISEQPRVADLVRRTIADWCNASRGSPRDLARRPPEALAATFRQIIGDPPVYYLWDREGALPESGRPVADRHHPDGPPAARAERDG